MKLDDLKKPLSTLDKILDKTNSDMRIDVSACETAQSKLLHKFRHIAVSCIIFLLVFTVLIIMGLAPSKFSLSVNILLDVFLLIGCLWYTFLYLRLRKINIATITPAELFSRTAKLKILMISGETFFVTSFLMYIIYAWISSPSAVWSMGSSFVVVILIGIFYTLPEYKKLFRDLNSTEE